MLTNNIRLIFLTHRVFEKFCSQKRKRNQKLSKIVFPLNYKEFLVLTFYWAYHSLLVDSDKLINVFFQEKEVESGGSTPRILSLDDYFMVEKEKDETSTADASDSKVTLCFSDHNYNFISLLNY